MRRSINRCGRLRLILECVTVAFLFPCLGDVSRFVHVMFDCSTSHPVSTNTDVRPFPYLAWVWANDRCSQSSLDHLQSSDISTI